MADGKKYRVISLYRVDNGTLWAQARNGVCASMVMQEGTKLHVSSLTGEGSAWYVDAAFRGTDVIINNGHGERRADRAGVEIMRLPDAIGRELWDIVRTHNDKIQTFGKG